MLVYVVARLHPKYLPIHHYNPRQPTLMAEKLQITRLTEIPNLEMFNDDEDN
jgi:hypothetical protein